MKKFLVILWLLGQSVFAQALEPRAFNRVKVDRVVDGDTAIMTVDLGFDINYKHSFRLYGIDTPEKGQPGFREATEALKSMIEGKTVSIDYFTEDKYGRPLATIYINIDGNLIDVNEYMIKKGLAKPYFGGPKP